MKYNAYDNDDFHSRYVLRRERELGAVTAIEHPAILSLLPSDMSGMHTLDLGCGMGQLSRAMRSRGASSVTAVDASRKMLDQARLRTHDDGIDYHLCCIEDFRSSASQYDVVASSLAMHYLEDFRSEAARVAIQLKENGLFLFSVEHPIYSASGSLEWHSCGAQEGRSHWPVDHYQKPGFRDSVWLGTKVSRYHRTFSQYIDELMDAGFTLMRVLEPAPTDIQIAKRPELELHLRRPPFLVFKVIKSIHAAHARI